MQADRFNAGKPEWSLVDFQSLEPMVRVLEFGAKKYSRNNWKKGLPINSILDSLMRHVIAYKDGEDLDPESGVSHIGHMMCNLMFLSYVDRNLKEKFDDREEPPAKEWNVTVDKDWKVNVDRALPMTQITEQRTTTDKYEYDSQTEQKESTPKQEVPGLEEGIPIGTGKL